LGDRFIETTMQDRIPEYVMGLMDPAMHAEMESALRQDADLRRQTELVRQAIAPLAADQADDDVSPALFASTIAKVAEHICSEHDLPHAPETIVDRTPGGERRWYQRLDVIVAASLLLFAVGVSAPFLLRSQAAAKMAECQNNLRQLFASLGSYRDVHGHFPSVAERPPHVAAGMVLPLLREAGVLPAESNLRCPNAPSIGEPELVGPEQFRSMTPEQFEAHAAHLSPYYAYSLGFRDDAGRLLPPGESAEVPLSLTALMSDAPPAYGVAGNSRNHDGKGQNVLFGDGHVRFATIRTVGYRGDDIFLNRDRKVAAGVSPQDAVLGWSGAQP
jgi:prepilin-type processing-associated H-X9-DG protein